MDNKLIIILLVKFIFITDHFLQIDGYKNNSILSRHIRQANIKCSRNQFKCKDGSRCISQTEICDGKIHCPDKSDETSNLCSGFDCYEFAFRCNYGACVDGNAPCNGVDDCADKSDELLPYCPGVKVSKNRCGLGKFTCNSGACISQVLLCDGQKDCSDGSDESITECRNMDCGEAFKCGYGACIDPTLKCNGQNDCADGSDESPSLCGGTVPTHPTNTPKPNVIDGCKLPPVPKFGSYTVNSRTDFLPGEIVSTNTVLLYKCLNKYDLDGDSVVVCLGHNWNKKIPDCIRSCNPLISDSLDLKCKYENREVSCKKRMLVGTVATFKCKPFYIRPVPLTFDSIICQADGTWDNSVSQIQCGADCGKKTPEGQILVVGGQKTKIGEYPWHVGVYAVLFQIAIQKCGGSLINQKLVLTAAHCFEDSVTPENFQIGGGKIFRDLYEKQDKYAQISNVSKIILHPDYRGQQLNYAHDIAIMVLVQPFTITGVLQLVCIDWQDEYKEIQEIDNSIGYIAGWGKTKEQGDPSDILLFLEAPFIQRDKCFDLAPVDFRELLTDDKICAGFVNQSKSVCEGDSGGGLTFRYNNRYFIRGIVSVGPDNRGECDSNQFATFTSVSMHLSWIRSIEVKNRL